MKTKISIKSNELLSFACLFCFVFADAIKESPVDSLSRIFMVMGIGAFGIQFVLRVWKWQFKMKVVKYVMLAVIPGGFLMQFLLRGDVRLSICVMGIFSALWLDDEHSLVKCLFWANLLAFSAAMLTGGYRQINIVAAHAGTVVLLYICNIQEKIRIVNLLVIIMVYAMLAQYTSSGSCIIALGVAVLLEGMLLLFPKITTRFLQSLIVKLWFPIVFLGNYLLAISCGTLRLPGILGKLPYSQRILIYKFTLSLDKFLSGRLSLGKFALKEFGISFWGGNVKPFSNFTYKDHYFNLDSGMLWILIGRGILVSILFLSAMTIITNYFSDRKQMHFLIAVISVALWGMNEDILTSISMNFILLFLGRSLLKEGTSLSRFIRSYLPALEGMMC